MDGLFSNINSKAKDLKLYGIYLLTGLLLYNMKITNDLSNPDSIWQGIFYKQHSVWETSLGRYMIGPLQMAHGYVVNTAMATILSLLLLSGACLLVVKIIHIESWLWQLAVGAVLIVSPTVGSTLTYYYCSDMYMLSYLLAVLAVYFMVSKKHFVIISAICIVLSLAIYQAYIGVAMVLCLIYLAKMIHNSQNNLKEVLKKGISFICVGILGVLSYLLSSKLVLKWLKLSAEPGRGFAEMGKIDWKNILVSLKNCYGYFADYFFGTSMINNACNGRKTINAVFFILLAGILILMLFKKEMDVKRKLCILVLCLFFPLASMIITIIAPQVSIFSTTGVLMLPTMNYVYVLAIAMMDVLRSASKISRFREGALLTSIAAVLVMLTVLEAGGQSYQKHNTLKTNHVAEQMLNCIGAYDGDTICIVGCMEDGNYPELYPQLRESQHWVTAYYKTIWLDYNGCQAVWQQLMKQNFGICYQYCSLEQYRQIIETPEYAAMGNFPQTDSVAMIDGVIVIKLSNAAW